MTLKQHRYAIYRKIVAGVPLTLEEQQILANSFYWANKQLPTNSDIVH